MNSSYVNLNISYCNIQKSCPSNFLLIHFISETLSLFSTDKFNLMRDTCSFSRNLPDFRLGCSWTLSPSVIVCHILFFRVHSYIISFLNFSYVSPIELDLPRLFTPKNRIYFFVNALWHQVYRLRRTERISLVLFIHKTVQIKENIKSRNNLPLP